MRIYSIFYLLIILCSCKRENYTSAKTILSQEFQNTGVVKYPDGNLRYLVDSVQGKEFGNLFEFYRNAYLASYSFKIDSIQASYVESFDSVSHKIISIEGTPIVYRIINADSHPDSMFVQYLVSNFSYDSIQFAIADSGKGFIDVPSDKLLSEYKTLNYVKAFTYIERTKDETRFYIIGKFTGKLKNTNTIKTYYDTIDLTKRKTY